MGPVNTYIPHGVSPRHVPIPRASLGMAGCQCQLMRQTTSVEICWQQGREDGGEDVEWVWLCGRCVAPPIQKMRLSVAWAALFSGLVEYMCSVAIWVLCVNCGMSCENWCP